MEWLIPAVFHGLVLGCVYCVLGWAFAYDSASSGYFNLAFGDIATASICLVWSLNYAVFHGRLLASSQYPGLTYAFLVVLTWIVIWGMRVLVHACVYGARREVRASRRFVVLSGVGLSLLLVGALDLARTTIPILGARLFDKCLDIPVGHAVNMWGIAITSTMIVQSVIFVVAVGIIAFALIPAEGMALVLIRENRRLTHVLGLPVGRIDAFNRAVGCLLLACAAFGYFATHQFTPSTGLKLTVYGFIFSTIAARRRRDVLAIGLSIGLFEGLIGGNIFTIVTGWRLESYWGEYVVLGLVGVGAYVRRESRRLAIVEDSENA